ncbi:hypothetical protein SRABI13_04511 [Erwinia aphidicola]|nr:hypothetical protein SRABI13_04511 [Erwinia aphidicola]
MPGRVHTDDIPVPVQEPGSGKTRTARLWVYVRDDRNAGSQLPPAVWFAYSPDRRGVHPQQHLAGYGGILQADAYGGYNALYDLACPLEKSEYPTLRVFVFSSSFQRDILGDFFPCLH